LVFLSGVTSDGENVDTTSSDYVGIVVGGKDVEILVVKVT
jgi:hypothetical protein